MRYLIWLFLLSACGQSTQFHLLPMPTTHNIIQQQGSKSYALRQVELPEYTRDKNVMVRNNHQEIIRFEKDKWVSLLDETIGNVLYQELKNQSKSAFYRYPIGGNIQADYLVDVYIQELLGNFALSEVLLVANYQIQEKSASEPKIYTVQKKYPLSENTISAMTKLYSQALHDLAKDIHQKLE